MRHLKNMLAVIMMAIVFIGVSHVCVYADYNPEIFIAGVDNTHGYMELCDDVNNEIWDKLPVWRNWGIWFLNCTVDNSDVRIEVNKTACDKLSQEERQNIIKTALYVIQDSNAIDRTHKMKIYNDLCELDETTSNLVRNLSDDVQSDFVGAYNSFSPFAGAIGTFFATLALIIFMIMGTTFVLDIAYINIPIFQNFLTKDNKRPAFISLEAYSAVMEADSKSGREHVDPTMLYMGHKTKQFCIMAICVLYLTSGQIFVIVSQVIDYFKGVLPS